MKTIKIQDIVIGEGSPLTIISGPCVIESLDHALKTAEYLSTFFRKKNIPFIYKSSYDKANRSSIHSFRGPGLEEGLKILERVKKEFSVPLLTDVHSEEEAREAACVCDILQIPAFLCRQTDLLVAAGKTQAVINIKKGQFISPQEMENVVKKVEEVHNHNILLTERGTFFGYNNLVNDMKAIPLMQELGYPVFFDATHSLQRPGALGTCSGGERKFAHTLAKAALGAGCNGIFAESHPNPQQAKSDAATVLSFSELSHFVEDWQRLYEAIHAQQTL